MSCSIGGGFLGDAINLSGDIVVKLVVIVVLVGEVAWQVINISTARSELS